MKGRRKDHAKCTSNRGEGALEETVDENVSGTDLVEVKGLIEDANKQVAKTFKHLRKDAEIIF